LQGRAAVRPKVLLKGERVLGDFEGGEGHGGKMMKLQREIRFKGGRDSGGTIRVMLRA